MVIARALLRALGFDWLRQAGSGPAKDGNAAGQARPISD
jgi:hypothetical protein